MLGGNLQCAIPPFAGGNLKHLVLVLPPFVGRRLQNFCKLILLFPHAGDPAYILLNPAGLASLR